MSKQTVFWICQYTGWGLVALVNFMLRTIAVGQDWRTELVANVVFLLAGVSATLFLRRMFKKVNILNKKPLVMLLTAFGLSLVSSALIVMIVITSMEIFDTLDGTSAFSFGMVLGNYIAVTPLVIVWATIYLTVQFLLQLRQSEIDKVALNSALHEAQLNTLIGQMNPHFMFNALNNIRSLMLEDVERARRSIGNLASVLRYSLTSTNQSFVLLSEELKVVEDYVALSKIHLEDRLEWHKNIEVQTDQVSIPPMFIQMLVENAIKHGISEVRGGGKLELDIRTQNETLVICVNNTGEIKPSATNSTSTNIGLENIKQRITLLYGDKANFELIQKGDEVQACLTLPLVAKEKSDD